MKGELPLYELIIDSEADEVNYVALVDRPAIKRNFLKFSDSQPFQFNEDKREIYGPAMIADMPIYRRDEDHGEFYVQFSKDTISKAARMFFDKGYQKNVNLFHDIAQQPGDVFVFQSWISDSNIGIAPLKGYEDVADGSWFIGMKINNNEVWERIKSEDVMGFSIEGLFTMNMKMEEQLTEKEIARKILDIINAVTP